MSAGSVLVMSSDSALFQSEYTAAPEVIYAPNTRRQTDDRGEMGGDEPDRERICLSVSLVQGEEISAFEKTVEGDLQEGRCVMTTWRLLVERPRAPVNVPLALIDQLEIRDLSTLLVYSKDGRVFRLQLVSGDSCQRWYDRLTRAAQPAARLDNTFAVAHYQAWVSESTTQHPDHPNARSAFGSEMDRLGFSVRGHLDSSTWRQSHVNEDYSLCPTYPQVHVVPAAVSDEELKEAAQFRAQRRFPAVVWRHRNGAVIARSGQPEVGLGCRRNTSDEKLLTALAGRRDLVVFDARSYAAAMANWAMKGGGTESTEYYRNCLIRHMDISNMHNIRKSFQQVRLLYTLTEQGSWLAGLQNTQWLHYLGLVLRAAVEVTQAVHSQGRSVLVHCSDGWDRTPQICALAELLMDGYYRTPRGFQVLVEREWLSFGHKFADRCGNGPGCTTDLNERSPIFLQFLDCVYQLLRQFPTAFAFNEQFLLRVMTHVYSGLFGTFLYNSERERGVASVKSTRSLWPQLLQQRELLNHFYDSETANSVLLPRHSVPHLQLWTNAYASIAGTDVVEETTEVVPFSPSALNKTKSCEDLSSIASEEETALSRRLSDSELSSPLKADAASTPSRRPSDAAASLSRKSSGIESMATENGSTTPKLPRAIPVTAMEMATSTTEISDSATRVAAALVAAQISRAEPLVEMTPIPPTSCNTFDSLPVAMCGAQRRMARLTEELVAANRRIAELERARRLSGPVSPRPAASEETEENSPLGTSLGSTGSYELLQAPEKYGYIKWVPDYLAPCCELCKATFNTFCWRHHCRHCGHVYCATCSSRSTPLPQLGLVIPQRVCDTCYTAITHRQQQRSPQPLSSHQNGDTTPTPSSSTNGIPVFNGVVQSNGNHSLNGTSQPNGALPVRQTTPSPVSCRKVATSAQRHG